MYFWKLFDKGLLGFIQPLLLLSIWFEAKGIQLYRRDEPPNRSAMLLLHHIIIKICRHGMVLARFW